MIITRTSSLKKSPRVVIAAIGLSLFTAGTLTACSPPSVSVVSEPTKHDIEALFDKWESTLQTEDPGKVAALYSDDAVLLPTVSNQTRDSRAKIEDYFVKFLSYKPKGTIDTEAVQVLDSDTAVNNGTYTFNLMKDGKAQSVNARFTFVYEKIKGEWLIVSHHSSMMPASS